MNDNSIKKRNEVCGLCNIDFITHSSLRKHLTSQHSLLIQENLEYFSNLNQFHVWKSYIETKSSTFFKFICSATTPSSTVMRYRCNRSGIFKSHGTGKRSAKCDGSVMKNYSCSAFMTVTKYKYTPYVHVRHCLNHYGHDTLPCRIRVTHCTFDRIRALYVEENSIENINNYFFNNGCTLKERSLTYKHLQNCLKSLTDIRGVRNIINQSNPFIVSSSNDFTLGVSDLCKSVAYLEFCTQNFIPIQLF